ncbi:cuticle protein 16.8-like [Oppia nitens]|uniref:cuticle protein 16.8-like n=1 Tax=Oppia nitens TaxID=1686743 RepID=UPI0023DBEC85|nr:cuticle protein 16.8-like [Oppia nitens]
MFKVLSIVCLLALIAVCNCQLGGLPIARALAVPVQHERPEPYSYGYTASDEFGTTWTRQESGDEQGNVRGSYSYREANGIGRTVEYTADAVNGFQAHVVTNEPGTVDHATAGALYRTTQ